MPDLEVIDWRRLLSSIHVSWIDRGPNVSKSSVNIACCFCGNDPSYHLNISLDGHGYYCFRNPSHAGRNYIRLLYALGVTRFQAVELLNKFRIAFQPEIPALPLPKQTGSWDRFLPAYESDACLDYLFSRGFPDPVGVAHDFDLRYAPTGRWANRLLLPLVNAEGAGGWTGRSIVNAQPRYKTEQRENAVYLPAPINAKTAIIVEGPLDALKGAAANTDYQFGFVAMLGLGLNDGRLLTLRHYLQNCFLTYLALDSGVSTFQRNQVKSRLAWALKPLYIEVLLLPPGIKDPGEMTITEITNWLRGVR